MENIVNYKTTCKALILAGFTTFLSSTAFANQNSTADVAWEQQNLDQAWKDSFVEQLEDSAIRRLNSGETLKIKVTAIGAGEQTLANQGVRVRTGVDNNTVQDSLQKTQYRQLGNIEPLSNNLKLSFDYAIINENGDLVRSGNADLEKRVTENAIKANRRDTAPLYASIIDDWLEGYFES
jgi:hypothetical protein